ncbi:ABC transporter permease [Oceanirhabdus seepicola]|uniref:FtsX-like permease family protein n=1 Tax=Oceanirhabdus seepicola TaxID=2828781 RepID=A0A9J6NXC7_9CLOT|nr:FtsX-like permease family protein [Oceanirhabdus seepicola]MCM1988915.1 FtsX-like permease family protein [Oceanirhabdus seepicola]
MTMNNVTAKLRQKNIKNYYLLLLCTILSVMLVTSFALIYFSKTVQTILPEGGDSRKQASMIFVIAIVGCCVFTTYASSLFFKYKSREFGIFMALGEKKKHLKKVLLKELSVVISAASAVGLVLSVPLSYFIWKIFQIFIVDTHEMQYQFSPLGFCYGMGFCIFVTLCIFISGVKFIKRSNIIEIITDSRKSEVVKDVKSWTGIAGWIIFFSGIFLGYMVPHIAVRKFNYRLPSIWNVTFLLSFVGIYKIMLYTVVHSKKGRNSKKYYRNIISSNMMRFAGKQTVRNMCVIAFLIAGALFAAFYTPTAVTGMFSDLKARSIDNVFFYRQDETQISKEEIYSLAHENNVKITDYFEAETISLIIDGVRRDYVGNKLIEEHCEKLKYSNFMSEESFNKISGEEVVVQNGQYLTVVSKEYTEGFWKKSNDLSLVTHPVTDITENLAFVDVVRFSSLSFDGTNIYVISNEDYERLYQGLTEDKKHKFVLFNVENPEETYFFTKKLRDEIINRSSENVAIVSSYDLYKKQMCEEEGEKYWLDDYNVELSVDNSQLFMDWKYYPMFKVVNSQDLIKNLAVFLMLFIYIAIICFAAVAIIAYTRSVTIAIDNKALFMNLKKLGANNKYIERSVKKQLAKIFIYPTIVGSTAIYLFFGMIMFANGGSNISSSEYMALSINFAIILIACAFMYSVYRIALRRVKVMIGIH